jgi:hypothetical protein
MTQEAKIPPKPRKSRKKSQKNLAGVPFYACLRRARTGGAGGKFWRKGGCRVLPGSPPPPCIDIVVLFCATPFLPTPQSTLSRRQSHSRHPRRTRYAPMLLAARAWLLTCSRLVFPDGQHHSANSEVQHCPSWARKARRHWRCKRPVKITIPMALAVFPELCSRGSCSRGPFPKGRLKNSPRTVLATPLTPAIEFHLRANPLAA